MTNISEPRLKQLKYIEAILGELRKLSAKEDCDMLIHMIEMAYVECNDIVEGRRPPKVLPSIKRID